MRASFSDLHSPEEHGGIPRGKEVTRGDLQRLQPPEFLTVMLVHPQPPAIFQNYCFHAMVLGTSALDKQISAVTFWIHLFLQILEWKSILQT